jgi:hypothetical protein
MIILSRQAKSLYCHTSFDTDGDVSACGNIQLSLEEYLFGVVLNLKFDSMDKFYKLYAIGAWFKSVSR